MPEEPENLARKMLREIRAKQDDHMMRLERIEKQLRGMSKVLTYTLGSADERQPR